MANEVGDIINPAEESFHELQEDERGAAKPKAPIHVCHQCGKEFATNNGQSRHLHKVHEQTGKYKCELCTKVFNEKRHFQGHMAGHADYRPFVCVPCGKSFQFRPSMLRHQKTCGKPTEKKYTCNECKASFRRKDMLKEHMNVHTPTRLYPCSKCGSKYLWRSSLKKHVSVKHPKD